MPAYPGYPGKEAVKQVSVWLMNYITFSSCGFVYFLRKIPIVLMAVAVLWNCWCQVVLQKSAGKCLNCLERNASLRLPVCHHKVLCEVCYMNTNECPTCQAAITIQQWHWMMMHEGRSQSMRVWVYGRRVWIYSSCWVGRRSASQCCCVSFWLAYSVMVHAQLSLHIWHLRSGTRDVNTYQSGCRVCEPAGLCW